jgi:enoyl-CoA hydratase/carnithine racemase
VTVAVSQPAVGVALVVLDRPEARNALDTAMLVGLRESFEDLGDARAVVVAGEGPAFCAGADVKERAGLEDDDAWLAQHHVLEAAFAAVRACPAPAIAAVDGAALGGGLELALSCDLVVAGAGATFGQPEVRRGIMPGGGATQLLPRTVGVARAKLLILAGEPIDAATALAWGLVAAVVPAGTARARALDLAGRIAANAPLAVRGAKAAIDHGDELERYAEVVRTQDRREGTRAFVERRDPRFEGR